MTRSATLLRIDPEVVSDVLEILNSEKREIPYSGNLAIFIKKVEKINSYSLVHGLIDVEVEIKVKKRSNGQIETEPQKLIKCEEFKLAYYPRITGGSSEIPHLVVVLGPKATVRVLGTAIEEIIRRRAFLRVQFYFTPSNETVIRNHFDDIVRITSEDILDAIIWGISLRGSRLYQAPSEYQKALSGKVKRIGVALNEDWFLIASSGEITTYKKLSDEEFIEKIYQIVVRLLNAGAVVL